MAGAGHAQLREAHQNKPYACRRDSKSDCACFGRSRRSSAESQGKFARVRARTRRTVTDCTLKKRQQLLLLLGTECSELKPSVLSKTGCTLLCIFVSSNCTTRFVFNVV